MLYFPLGLVSTYFLFFLLPLTRKAALWSLEENHPVELITFIFFFLAAVQGFKLTIRLKRGRNSYPLSGFYLLFSVGVLLVALEEIAWGQFFLGFETPGFWRQINYQGETTLHNIHGLQGHSEVFRLIFGGGALIGLLLSQRTKFTTVACPRVLIFWAVIITTHAALDVFNDYIPIHKLFDFYMQRTSELIEMMIGICAFLYIFLNSKLLENKQMIS